MKNQSTYEMRPIGYIKCPGLKNRDDCHNKPKGQKLPAELILDDSLTEALDDIETFDHVWLIWVFSQNVGKGYEVKVYPRPDPKNLHGLFVTRSPFRPNPIGLSCVEVLGRDGNILKFNNSDIYDGTPVLDIKPYIPSGDSHPDSRAGWLSDLNL